GGDGVGKGDGGGGGAFGRRLDFGRGGGRGQALRKEQHDASGVVVPGYFVIVGFVVMRSVQGGVQGRRRAESSQNNQQHGHEHGSACRNEAAGGRRLSAGCVHRHAPVIAKSSRGGNCGEGGYRRLGGGEAPAPWHRPSGLRWCRCRSVRWTWAGSRGRVFGGILAMPMPGSGLVLPSVFKTPT